MLRKITWLSIAACLGACELAESADDAEPSDCAPADDPTILTIEEVAPAPGSLVPNVDIVHRLVIADAPGVFTSLSFLLEAEHTSGTLDPPMPVLTIVPRGDDLECSLPPVRWTEVGHVEVTFDGDFVDDDGCYYTFPPGIFSYDLQEP